MEQLLQNFWKRVQSFARESNCKRVDEHGSATEQKPGRGRPKTAQTEENVRYLKLLISKNQTMTLILCHFAKY